MNPVGSAAPGGDMLNARWYFQREIYFIYLFIYLFILFIYFILFYLLTDV